MKKLVLAALVTAGCSSPDPQPSLQSYGAIFPICVLFCRAAITSADIAEGASQTTTLQSSSSTGIGGAQ